MNFLSKIMLEVLQFFYAIGGHNYGLAIIWLTVAVNLALYPLTLSSTKQMSAMQKIQPRMKKLQEKHKDEPQKLQKEIMEMYKSEGVNPLGGCLPVLLKIPFFIGLFWALNSAEFAALIATAGENTGFLWIANITKPDPLKIMPILIGLSTWAMQKSLPSAGEQAKMMTWLMPGFIMFISFNFPAGVQIYWIVSNAVAAAQQFYIMRGMPKATKADNL